MGIGHETFTFFGPESYLKRWMEGREFPVWLNPHIEKNTQLLVGGFNQNLKNNWSNWTISPGKGKNKKCLKPPPRLSRYIFQASRQHLRIRRSITFMLAFLRCGLHRTKVIGNFGGCVFKSLQIVGHPKRSSSNHPFSGVNLLLV